MKKTLSEAFELNDKNVKVYTDTDDYDVFKDKALLDNLRNNIIQNLVDNNIPNDKFLTEFINEFS